MIDLSGLDKHTTRFKPSPLDMVYYLFFSKGITLEKFNALPIPYIKRMVETHAYIKEQEARAMKNASKK